MNELTDLDGMEKVVCIPQAKVRIVKIWDPKLKLSCDMNVNNTLALENTRMIKTYIEIDERVRPLAMIIKHWTKQRILNAAGKSYAPFVFIPDLDHSARRHNQLIYLDMHDLEFSSDARSTDTAVTTQPPTPGS